MALATFPVKARYGSSIAREYKEVQRVYDGGTYRRYLKASFEHKRLKLEFKGMTQAQRSSIETFFEARKANTTSTDYEFLVYNPDENETNTGSTGRYRAIFTEATLTFTREGPCRWNSSIEFFLLDAE